MRLFAALLVVLALAPLASAATVSHEAAGPLIVLRYTAAVGEANRLSISEDGASVVFRDAGALLDVQGSCTSTSPNEARCPRADRVLIALGDRDDEASVAGVPAGIFCPPFRLSCGPALVFIDDAGDDRYRGGPGGEAFEAGDVGTGADEFLGGPGQDEVGYVARIGQVFLSLDDRANDGGAGERDNIGSHVEDAHAGPGGMTFFGSAAANGFYGYPYRSSLGAGRDLAFGGAGVDIIHGGFGDDRLAGGPDGDAIWGERGRDLLRGGTGRDQLFGGVDADVLRGGGDRDRLQGNHGRDLYCARDGARDRVTDGGRSIDRAYVDALDVVSAVELVFRRPCPR